MGRVLDAARAFFGRNDAWVNSASGQGTYRDRTTYSDYCFDVLLPWSTLSNMYYGDDITRTIVESFPKDALSKGYRLCADDMAAASELQEWAETTHTLSRKMLQGLYWGRLYGGALMLFGAMDAQDIDKPLADTAVARVPWIDVEDRRYALPNDFFTELGPQVGLPSTYRITHQTIRSSSSFVIHESRCVRFGGEIVDKTKARTLYGWDLSVVQRPFVAARQLATAYASGENMLSDASQPVVKMKGLLAQLVAPGGADEITQRFTMMQMSRSIVRALILDSDNESFEKIENTFTGVPDMMAKFQERLSAATNGIPVSRLFGVRNTGLGNGNATDLTSWFQVVEAYRTHDVTPAFLRAYRILSLDKTCPTGGKILKGMRIEYDPLWQPSDIDRATAYKTRAEGDQVYVAAGAVDAIEVALSRFGGGKYSDGPLQINEEKLKAELAGTLTLDPTVDPKEEKQDPDADDPSADAPLGKGGAPSNTPKPADAPEETAHDP